MRLAFVLLPLLLTAGCIMPRPWKTEHYAKSCDPAAPTPTDDAQLLITLRLPHCVDGKVVLTQYRGDRVRYASVSGGIVAFHKQSDWESVLQARVKRRGGRPPILYIHGYNNDNAEALQTAAQIAQALKGNREVVALTWPSYGRKRGYFWDEANAEWSIDDATAAAVAFVASVPSSVIVAHSMGNRLAIPIVRHLASTNMLSRVDRLVMASPDVDRAAVGRFFNAPGGPGVKVTLYASRKDQPLSGSWRGHGYPRAGDFSWWVSGRQPYFAYAKIDDVEVVDTTEVDRSMLGHRGFIDPPAGAADLCRVITGLPARGVEPFREPPGAPANYLRLTNAGGPDDCSPPALAER